MTRVSEFIKRHRWKLVFGVSTLVIGGVVTYGVIQIRHKMNELTSLFNMPDNSSPRLQSRNGTARQNMSRNERTRQILLKLDSIHDISFETVMKLCPNVACSIVKKYPTDILLKELQQTRKSNENTQQNALWKALQIQVFSRPLAFTLALVILDFSLRFQCALSASESDKNAGLNCIQLLDATLGVDSMYLVVQEAVRKSVNVENGGMEWLKEKSGVIEIRRMFEKAVQGLKLKLNEGTVVSAIHEELYKRSVEHKCDADELLDVWEVSKELNDAIEEGFESVWQVVLEDCLMKLDNEVLPMAKVIGRMNRVGIETIFSGKNEAEFEKYLKKLERNTKRDQLILATFLSGTKSHESEVEMREGQSNEEDMGSAIRDLLRLMQTSG